VSRTSRGQDAGRPDALLSLAALLLAAASPALAQPAPPVDPEALFDRRCKSCHEPAIERAPTRAALAQRPAAEILGALTTGPMAPMAAGLSGEQMRALAAFLGAEGRAGGAAPEVRDVACTANPPLKAGAHDWASWGLDPGNRRYQTAGGLKAADAQRLKLKWAFSVRGGVYGQPTVVGDWLFLAVRGGGFYALDARSGCVRWHVDESSRTTPVIARSSASPSGWITWLAVGKQVKAFDAATGKSLWTSPVLESHAAARINGPLALHGDQLFVPLSSVEEGAGTSPAYPCCSFRGSLVALSARTGERRWQTYVITEPLKPIRPNASGVMLQGPAGAAIWSSPTVDGRRGLVYVATGDSYTEAATAGADAIVAIEMTSGAIRWSTQVTANDNFIVTCNVLRPSVNCPNPSGPDHDFGAPPILFTLPGGKDVVLSGQKSSMVYGMDADTGALLWKTAVGTGSSLGGVEWGMAADDRRLYVPNSDIAPLMDEYLRPRGQAVLAQKPGPAQPGLTALDPATGRVLWRTPAPKAPCVYAGDRSRDRVKDGVCFNAQSAAATVIPGMVFSGTIDGWFRAYDAPSGRILWQFSTTAQTYQTVNGVKDQPGGSIDSMGPTVAAGMVYVISGYGGAAGVGGNPVNVLLAFSPDGR
jgi:polyvinyl alcohol dehydrogenase (cytochrome)